MYDINTAYLQSELEYRAARIKQGVAVRNRNRRIRLRRHTEATPTR
jgi:hypothetical protein